MGIAAIVQYHELHPAIDIGYDMIYGTFNYNGAVLYMNILIINEKIAHIIK